MTTGRGVVFAPSLAHVCALAAMNAALRSARALGAAIRSTTARRRAGSSSTFPSKAVIAPAAAATAPARRRSRLYPVCAPRRGPRKRHGGSGPGCDAGTDRDPDREEGERGEQVGDQWAPAGPDLGRARAGDGA